MMEVDVIVLGAFLMPIWLPLLLIAASKDTGKGQSETP